MVSSFLCLGVMLAYTGVQQGRPKVRSRTYLSKVLPKLLLFVRLAFPLLTNDFGDLRIVQTWIATDDFLLMVLPIKDERYKGVSGCSNSRRKQRT